MTQSWRRQQVNGEDAGVVHFHGSDAQGEHSTLCGHSWNFDERRGREPLCYEETYKPVNCKACLLAAEQVLQVLGLTKARRAAIVRKAAGT